MPLEALPDPDVHFESFSGSAARGSMMGHALLPNNVVCAFVLEICSSIHQSLPTWSADDIDGAVGHLLSVRFACNESLRRRAPVVLRASPVSPASLGGLCTPHPGNRLSPRWHFRSAAPLAPALSETLHRPTPSHRGLPSPPSLPPLQMGGGRTLSRIGSPLHIIWGTMAPESRVTAYCCHLPDDGSLGQRISMKPPIVLQCAYAGRM
jgi:hypothetical protein